MDTSTALSIVAGGLITIAAAIVVEWAKRPRLAIDVARPASDPRWKILHVKVINKPVGGLVGRLLLRNDARGCRVRIQFLRHNVTGPPIHKLEIGGRWSATPQPLSIVSTPQGLGAIFDINKVPQTERFDLQPDAGGEAVAVAIKHSDDKGAYAFNSESYMAWTNQLDFRHAPFDLEMAQYDVIVTASVGGIKPTIETFHLTCDSTGFALTR
jgi:hypothetical protein